MATVVHLSTGEDFIGTVERMIDGGGNEAYNLLKPMRLGAMPTQDGRIQIKVIPLSFFLSESLDKITIRPDQVIFEAPPTPQIEQMYKEATSTLIMPGKGSPLNIRVG